MMLNGWIENLKLGDWEWLHPIPVGELGGTLFGAGLLSTLFEYSFRKEQEEATVEQFRQIIHEQAPAMRDAVIKGFRFQRQDLERIATRQLLDDLAETSVWYRRPVPGLAINDPKALPWSSSPSTAGPSTSPARPTTSPRSTPSIWDKTR